MAKEIQVSLTTGTPPANMTDDQWQEYFIKMKPLVTRSSKKRMSNAVPLFYNGKQIGVTYDSPDSDTGSYCRFINSVLKTIREGDTDYLYNIYQVADLLQFEFDRLHTKLLPEYGCIMVWLADK